MLLPSHSFLKNSQFKYLGSFYLHSLIRLLAVSMFQFFNGLYIFQTLRTSADFDTAKSLAVTSLFFSVMFLAQSVAIAPAVWFIAKKGLKFSVFWGSIFLVGFYLILFAAKFDPIFLFIAAIFGGLQISLYWTAYHIYFTELTDDKHQGRQVSVGLILSAVVLIAGPAFGGLMIAYGGFGAVFAAMITLVLLSVFPLKLLPNKTNTVNINILEIVSGLNPKKEIKSYLSLLGIGASDIIYQIFWPIYIFPILSGFAQIGFMAAIGAFVTSVATLGMGVLIDKIGPKKFISYISPLDSLVWIAKTMVATSTQIYILSALRGITFSGQGMSLDSLVYERARHKGLVGIIVQRELGLALGRFLFLFLLGIAFWFNFPLVGVLLLGAIVALLPSLYPKTKI